MSLLCKAHPVRSVTRLQHPQSTRSQVTDFGSLRKADGLLRRPLSKDPNPNVVFLPVTSRVDGIGPGGIDEEAPTLTVNLPVRSIRHQERDPHISFLPLSLLSHVSTLAMPLFGGYSTP